jgi:hypothetical protein
MKNLTSELNANIDILNAKIEALKVKHEIETAILNKLGTIKTSFIGDNKETGFLTCKPQNKAELNAILKQYKPTKENRIVKTCNKSHEIKSPFKLELINPCSISNYSNFELKIVYKSNEGFDIWITYPIDEIKEFLKSSQRNITSSEYHYFTGYSQRELNELIVKMWLFDTDKSLFLNMYGGNQYLLDVDLINKIIDKLTK